MIMGNCKVNPNLMVGSHPLKVLQAPNDASPYQQISWQWPYTSNDAVFQQTLTSYAPNAQVFGQPTPFGNFSIWDVSWNNSGGGMMTLLGPVQHSDRRAGEINRCDREVTATARS
jgi:hypothetical protein